MLKPFTPCNCETYSIRFNQLRCDKCFAKAPLTTDGKQLDLFNKEVYYNSKVGVAGLLEETNEMFRYYGCTFQATLIKG